MNSVEAFSRNLRGPCPKNQSFPLMRMTALLVKPSESRINLLALVFLSVGVVLIQKDIDASWTPTFVALTLPPVGLAVSPAPNETWVSFSLKVRNTKGFMSGFSALSTLEMLSLFSIGFENESTSRTMAANMPSIKSEPKRIAGSPWNL